MKPLKVRIIKTDERGKTEFAIVIVDGDFEGLWIGVWASAEMARQQVKNLGCEIVKEEDE